MENQASSKQIMFASVAIIIATSLLTKHLYTTVRNEAWIAIAAGTLVSLCVLATYTALAGRFPGLSLVGINDAVFGRILGKIVSALYIYFFFTVAMMNANVLGAFVKSFILTATPPALTITIFVILCAWAVKKGGASLLKYGAVIVIVSVTFILLNTLLLAPKTDVRNLMPVFTVPLKNYLAATHSTAMIPLCDPFALMMLLPVLRDPKEFGRAMVKGLLVGAIILFVIVVRDIAVLGPGTETYAFPSLIAVRQINVGDILTRIDIIYISILVTLMFY
jgi:spore germination protein KB